MAGGVARGDALLPPKTRARRRERKPSAKGRVAEAQRAEGQFADDQGVARSDALPPETLVRRRERKPSAKGIVVEAQRAEGQLHSEAMRALEKVASEIVGPKRCALDPHASGDGKYWQWLFQRTKLRGETLLQYYRWGRQCIKHGALKEYSTPASTMELWNQVMQALVTKFETAAAAAARGDSELLVFTNPRSADKFCRWTTPLLEYSAEVDASKEFDRWQTLQTRLKKPREVLMKHAASWCQTGVSAFAQHQNAATYTEPAQTRTTASLEDRNSAWAKLEPWLCSKLRLWKKQKHKYRLGDRADFNIALAMVWALDHGLAGGCTRGGAYRSLHVGASRANPMRREDQTKFRSGESFRSYLTFDPDAATFKLVQNMTKRNRLRNGTVQSLTADGSRVTAMIAVSEIVTEYITIYLNSRARQLGLIEACAELSAAEISQCFSEAEEQQLFIVQQDGRWCEALARSIKTAKFGSNGEIVLPPTGEGRHAVSNFIGDQTSRVLADAGAAQRIRSGLAAFINTSEKQVQMTYMSDAADGEMERRACAAAVAASKFGCPHCWLLPYLPLADKRAWNCDGNWNPIEARPARVLRQCVSANFNSPDGGSVEISGCLVVYLEECAGSCDASGASSTVWRVPCFSLCSGEQRLGAFSILPMGVVQACEYAPGRDEHYDAEKKGWVLTGPMRLDAHTTGALSMLMEGTENLCFPDATVPELHAELQKRAQLGAKLAATAWEGRIMLSDSAEHWLVKHVHAEASDGRVCVEALRLQRKQMGWHTSSSSAVYTQPAARCNPSRCWLWPSAMPRKRKAAVLCNDGALPSAKRGVNDCWREDSRCMLLEPYEPSYAGGRLFANVIVVALKDGDAIRLHHSESVMGAVGHLGLNTCPAAHVDLSTELR